MTAPPRLAPQAERIPVVDSIRGFALLGVLLMNIQFFFRGPSEAYAFSPHPFPGAADVAADWILALFFEGKSVSLFSFLFGVGLAIQLERADATGVGFRRYAFRRLSVLLLFGAIHIALLWMGDILHVYAVLGFAMLLFLRRRPRTLLIWAGVLLLLPWLVTSAAILVGVLLPTPARPFNPARAMAMLAESLRAYGAGTWVEAARFRLRDYVHHTSPGMLARFLPYAFGLFLLGLWTWKRGILRAPQASLPFLRRFFAVAFPSGLALTLAYTIASEAHRRSPLGNWLGITEQMIGTPLLALSYGAGLLILSQRDAWRPILAPLAPVGRMALTNYLMHSVVMTWLYNGYGLGLYGKVGPALAALLGAALFALQIPLSGWWLSRHRFGPVEWLWRTLTYGEIQPMRIRALP
jgi:uncharacterized protein